MGFELCMPVWIYESVSFRGCESESEFESFGEKEKGEKVI